MTDISDVYVIGQNGEFSFETLKMFFKFRLLEI